MKTRTTESKLMTSCLIILTAIALSFALYYAKPVLIPFVFAIFLSYTIAPLADILQNRTRMPRILAVIISLLVGIIILVLFGMLLYSSFKGLGQNIKLYQTRIGQMAADMILPLENMVGDLDIREQLSNLPVSSIITRTLGNFTGILTNTFLILIFTVYLVFGRQPQHKNSVFQEMDIKIKKYLSVKLITSATTGILVWITLWIIGLDLALAFGILAFLLNLIPSVGSIISTLLPLAVALVQFNTATPIILVIVIPGTIQITIGNFIEPKFMGDSLELHPITVLLSLVFWGMVWGIMGMFVAVPITAVIKIVLGQIDQTRSLSQLMAGRLE